MFGILQQGGTKMAECLVVGLGGFIGSVCRYLIGLIPINERGIFPVKTFLINIAGSFLIGLITAAALKNHSLHPRLVLFLKTGICGGFTTFSTYALETGELFRCGNSVVGILYAVLSVTVGILAVFAGDFFIK